MTANDPTTRKLHTVTDKIDGHTLLLYRGYDPKIAKATVQEAGRGAVARTFEPGRRTEVRH